MILDGFTTKNVLICIMGAIKVKVKSGFGSVHLGQVLTVKVQVELEILTNRLSLFLI